MSVFDTAASGLSQAAGALDKASGILGDKQAAGAALPDTPPKYYQGDWIGQPPGGAGGSTAPFDLRVQDRGEIMELIHFGWVHGDYTTNFNHDNFDDTAKTGLPAKGTAGHRAIMYRAALERETLLLSGFVSSTQNVLKDREDSEGGGADMVGKLSGGAGGPAGFGALAGVAGNLLGGGGSTSGAAAKSGDLNGVNDKIRGVGQKLNSTEPMTYAVSHQAGQDLHQARTNYRVYFGKILNPPPPPKDGGSAGLLSSISSISSIVPGAGDIFSLVQGIATKVFDIYVMVYAQLAYRCELPIEKACHDLTLTGINENACPVFPLWFHKLDDDSSTDSDSSGPDAPLLSTSTDGNSPNMGDQLKQAPGKLKDQGEKAGIKALKDFFKVDEDNFYGSAAVKAALAVDCPAPDQKQPPSATGDLVSQAFEKALGLTVPPFAKEVMSQIMQMDSDLLDAIYAKLIGWDGSQTIPKDQIYQAARERLLQRMVDLVMSQLSFLKDAASPVKNFTLTDPANKKNQVSGGDALNKGSALAMDELADKLKAEIDLVLDFAMGDLVSKLDAARGTASNEKCMSMEVYLGRLPYLRALLFRNTFFPVWDILVKQVFGNAAGPISSFMNSAGGFFKGAKGYTDQVRDVAHRAKNVDDTFEKQGRNVAAGIGGGQNNLGLYKDAWDSGGAPQDSDNPDARKMKQDFPLAGRRNMGSGKPILQAEWNGVQMIPDPRFTAFKSPPDAPPAPPPPAAPAPASSPLPSLPGF